MDKKDLGIFLSTIHRLKGVDLSSYQQKFLLRRLNYRIIKTKAESIFDYLNLVKKDSTEFSDFLDALAINVSEFFRDPDVFDSVRKDCLPELIRRKELLRVPAKIIRIWSAGCAGGQEAYSLAILLNEELAKKDNFFVKIWGTDIDKDALQSAKRAEYSSRSLREINKPMLSKYFSCLPDGSFRVTDQIRQLVKFRQSDLLDDAPLKYMDVILCRNVMIYLTKQQQGKLIFKLYKSLSSHGYLVIGKAESIWGDLRDIFNQISGRQKIFQKK